MRRRVLLAVLGGVLILSSGVAQAAITHPYTGISFGPGGVGSGSFGAEMDLAVQQSTGDVFVLSRNEGGSVYKFNAAGEPVDFSSTGTNVIVGTGYQEVAQSEIAVDSSTGPDAGDIYVANFGVVNIYSASGVFLGRLSGGSGGECGVAIDPSGNVYTASRAQGVIRRYKPVTNPVTEADETGEMGGLEEKNFCNLAVDANGNVYAAKFSDDGVYEYEALQFGSLAASGTLIDERGRMLAFDGASDEVFISAEDFVEQYDGSAHPPTLQGTSTISEKESFRLGGVAVNDASGKLYVGDQSQVEILGPGVTVASASTEVASGLSASEATMNGSVAPEGTEVTGCVFEYGTEVRSLDQSVPCEPATPYTGSVRVAVSANLPGLQAATTYYYRVAESNSTYSSTGATLSFTTRGPQIQSSSVSETKLASAVVQGSINPQGEATSYYVEYGPTTAYGSSTAPISAGSGETAVAVMARITQLQPETAYHARLVGVNGAATTYGPDLEFTTQTMVTQEYFTEVGTKGATLRADINTAEEPTTYRVEYGITSAYGSSSQPVGIPAEEAPFPVVVRLGELESNTTYHFRFVAENASFTRPGPDLTFTTHALSPAGLPDGRGYEMVTPADNQGAETYVPYDAGFTSEDAIPTTYPFEAAADGSAVTYVGSPTSGGNGSQGESEGNQYLARRASSGGWTQTDLQPAGYKTPAYWGFSSNLQYGILDADEPLGTSPIPLGYDDLYVHDNATGTSQSLLTAPPPYRSKAKFGAIADLQLRQLGLMYAGASADYSHQLFAANDALTPESEGSSEENFIEENNLYDAHEGRLSAVNVLPDGSPAPNAVFGRGGLHPQNLNFDHVISANGERIFWTDLNNGALYVRENDSETKLVTNEGKYVTASADGSRVLYLTEGELYEDQVATGTTQDLAPGGEVLGVVGASEDLEYVYFVADTALAAHSTPGQPNLYLLHGGETRFIATLGRENEEVLGQYVTEKSFTGSWVPWSENFSARTAEVTPSGHGLVFMSVRSLTGYDNTIRGTSEATHEVYVYDADSGALSCASCDPSGEQPVGASRAINAGPFETGGFFPVSGFPTFQERVISDNGSRVFFESQEPLLPQAQNGVLNVYEWERDGVGSCQLANGCIYLLSTGSSSTPSYLIGASDSGDDVFMVTRSQLVPADQNGYNDVYDARVGAAEPPATPQCTGTGCQGAQATPPVFATPASATYAGVGNFAAPATPAAKPSVKKKGKKQQCVVKKKKSKVKPKKSAGSAKAKSAPCKAKKTGKRARNGKSERGGR